MANFIYSRTTDKDLQTFYLVNNGKEYYLFTQKFYRGVKNYFHNKVLLNDALDMTKTNRDRVVVITMLLFGLVACKQANLESGTSYLIGLITPIIACYLCGFIEGLIDDKSSD